jgi:ribonucleotide reductase beta subunit family protein with ferritin-like domain
MMCNAFSFMELNAHAPFYAKLNQALMIDTEDFYLSYKNDPILAERIKFVHEAVEDEDLLYAIAVFTLMENCVLYSSFAFLKHFQSEGKSLLKNVVAGINFSAKDENLHATGASFLFRTTLEEAMKSDYTEYIFEERELLFNRIKEVARNIYEHESRIIDMLFEHGDIEGISKEDLNSFVKSRVNLTLENLDIEPIFEINDNPIAEWFYAGISGTQFHDFFQVTGNEYNRDWNEEEFTF